MGRRVVGKSPLEKDLSTVGKFKFSQAVGIHSEMRVYVDIINREWKKGGKESKNARNAAKALVSHAGRLCDLGDDRYVEVASDIRRKVDNGSYKVGEYREDFRMYSDSGPQHTDHVLYSLSFILFSLGGLLLLNNITGNVVGFAEGGSIVGAVLMVLGTLGVLAFSWKK